MPIAKVGKVHGKGGKVARNAFGGKAKAVVGHGGFVHIKTKGHRGEPVQAKKKGSGAHKNKIKVQPVPHKSLADSLQKEPSSPGCRRCAAG